MLECGELAKAQEHLERSIKIFETVYKKPDHFLIPEVLNNLGVTFKELKELDIEKKHILRALEIDKSIFGENHHTAGRDLYNTRRYI